MSETRSFDDLLESLTQAGAVEGAVRTDEERVPPQATSVGLEAPAFSATPISRPAIDLIIAAEISSKGFYQARLTHPIWPGGRSGVTIGIGYDVGTVEPGRLRQDWAAELSAQDLSKLAGACGVMGQAASGLVPGLAAVTVAYDPAERVFFAQSVPQFVAQTERALPNTNLLGPDCLGALVSLTYNRGPSFNAQGDRFIEMRAIRDHMAARQFDKVPGEFRRMTRLWKGDPNARGLLLRREAEAVLFERGLGGGGTEAVVLDADPHLDPDAPAPEMPQLGVGPGLEAVRPWRVAEALLTLRAQMNAIAPRRSKVSDGTIGDAAHATRSSDHNPWIIDGGMGVVTGMDLTHDPEGGCSGEHLAEALRGARDTRIKYVIWNRRIFSATVSPWEWRPYTGANPHNHHVHVSVSEDKARYDSTASWSVGPPMA